MNKKTNFEKLKEMSLEELAHELYLIASWESKERNKAVNIGEQFFRNWLMIKE